MAHALRFPPIAVVVRALDNPQLNAWIEGLRTSTGNSVIHRRGALRQHPPRARARTRASPS